MHRLAFGNQMVNLEHGADNSAITRCKDIEEWAKDIYRFVCDKWGEENIIGFYVHLDEKIRTFIAPCCPSHSKISFHTKSYLPGITRMIPANGPFSFTMSWLWSTRSGDLVEDRVKPRLVPVIVQRRNIVRNSIRSATIWNLR